MRWLMQTDDDLGRLVVRVVLGSVMVPSGLQAVDWYGGLGYHGVMHFLVEAGLPPAIAFLVVVVRLVGPPALILGLFGRLAAFGILCDMLRLLHMNLETGLVSNSYFLLASAIALAVVLGGSGALSVDRALTRRAHPSRGTGAPG